MASLPPIQTTGQLKVDWATILVYAIPRWGKTDAIRTLVEAGLRVLIIGTDQGKAAGSQTVADLNIPIVIVKDWETAQAVMAELKKRPGKAQYLGQEFDVIFVDSLSGFGDIWMRKGLQVLNWEEVGVAAPGKDPRRIYAYIPEKGRQTIKGFEDVQAHIIYVCRETMQDEQVGEGRTVQYPAPELPGAKLPRELPGWIDGVVFGKILNGHRVLLTEAEGKVIAGIRMPREARFSRYIKPNYALLIKAMMSRDPKDIAACTADISPKPKPSPVSVGAPAPVSANVSKP